MDAPNFAISVMLSQLGEDNLFFIGFCSRKFSLVEINYEILNRGFLAILDSFEKWCHLLEKAQHKIIMYLDHKNLQYFMTTCVLNRLQAWWALSLSQFQFIIIYHPRH
jgi:hypothetical protein